MELAVVALTFATIFVVELPDKTFVATLVLSTRLRPLLVWLGVGAAFLVQTLIAVTLGRATTLLPAGVVQGIAAAIFLIGAVLLIREGRDADEAEVRAEAEYAAKAPIARTGLKAAVASFVVLFAAEWGDLSQLLTISLVGKYEDPVSVFAGAWGALLTVSALACIAGRWLLQHVSLTIVHYVGAGVCLVLLALTVYEILR